MRFIALDVHRNFCEVAIAEGGAVRLAGRVRPRSEPARALRREPRPKRRGRARATGNALPIARITEPHVARVVLAKPKAVKGLTQAGPRIDKADARAQCPTPRRSCEPLATLDPNSFHAVVAGSGPDADSVASEIERLGLGDSVELLGVRDDVAEILAGACRSTLRHRAIPTRTRRGVSPRAQAPRPLDFGDTAAVTLSSALGLSGPGPCCSKRL
jgi:hypothetical protein